ncbi:hypothetical protein CWE15_04395 [Aliidiomarina taiwanensis]|uniref:IrrE N-terminal-like domain-containing protein n=1 Tax=Aliidiomarina taiwanensis TaxID=946228 RepID=A0A432X739_9GAMM|nr:ImmA/IrrE family metallo-endopeptidase [Aliidiomarina taiwanensis]RUO42658.1 hypothetical protein CWE15_04395 [Aliidiomarina taiwanensis]
MGLQFIIAEDAPEHNVSGSKRLSSAFGCPEEIWREYKDNLSFPLDIYSLASDLGLVVRYRPLDNEISGFLKQIDSRWTATINAIHSESRKRFTLAHELGHFLLHTKGQDDKEFKDTTFFRHEDNVGTINDYSREESEANHFAAKLLMPKEEFIEAANSLKSISAVANKFGVSPMAVRIRSQNIHK